MLLTRSPHPPLRPSPCGIASDGGLALWGPQAYGSMAPRWPAGCALPQGPEARPWVWVWVCVTRGTGGLEGAGLLLAAAQPTPATPPPSLPAPERSLGSQREEREDGWLFLRASLRDAPARLRACFICFSHVTASEAPGRLRGEPSSLCPPLCSASRCCCRPGVLRGGRKGAAEALVPVSLSADSPCGSFTRARVCVPITCKLRFVPNGSTACAVRPGPATRVWRHVRPPWEPRGWAGPRESATRNAGTSQVASLSGADLGSREGRVGSESEPPSHLLLRHTSHTRRAL